MAAPQPIATKVTTAIQEPTLFVIFVAILSL
jgi:hypothetical protein